MTDTTYITADQHRALMATLGRAKVADALRHKLIFGHTHGRTTSSKELTEPEFRDLMWKFEHDKVAMTNPGVLADALLREAVRQKRAAILAIAGRVGFFPDSSSNFDYLNAWMLNSSILKKELWKYNLDELPALLKQFRGIEANFEKSAQVPGTRAWHIKHKIPMSANN